MRARRLTMGNVDLDIARFTQYEISVRLLLVELHRIKYLHLPIIKIVRSLNNDFKFLIAIATIFLVLN